MLRFRAVAVWLLSLAVLRAQVSPTQAPATPTPEPVIKVTTQLIQLSVVVHDHHGNPIADLKKEDFEVTDQGKPQNVSLFSVDSLAPSAPGANSAPATPTMPRNVVTNRPERRTDAPTSVTVLLLDIYNTHFTDQMANRRQVVKFLRQIRPDDRVAVYLLQGSGFRVVHDFTNNSESLLASLAKVFPGFSHELDASEFQASNTGNDDLDSALDASHTMMANFYTRNRILNSCIAFKLLSQHLAGIPGRKNVVWLSGGFPIGFGYGDDQDSIDRAAQSTGAAASDKELLTEYIEAASQAMNTASVAVYPVDARGLMGLPMADASKTFKMDPRTHQLPSSAMHVDTNNIDTMKYIADLTGGKAYYNTNDIAGALRKAIDDSSVSYTLGYYVPESSFDGKFHRIKVKVLRSGASLRTKTGYFAQEQPAPDTAKLAQLLHEAVWSPLDSTLIGVTGRIDPSPALPGRPPAVRSGPRRVAVQAGGRQIRLFAGHCVRPGDKERQASC
ncbi:MAG: VWA domain-containing protein [Bryobacteraceae bacterium]